MADDENSRYERRSWPELKRLAEQVPEAGIHFQSKLSPLPFPHTLALVASTDRVPPGRESRL